MVENSSRRHSDTAEHASHSFRQYQYYRAKKSKRKKYATCTGTTYSRLHDFVDFQGPCSSTGFLVS
jgi:hypothetical protein